MTGGESIMKKSAIMLLLFVLSVSMTGQSTLDQLLKAKALNSYGKYELAIRGLTESIRNGSDYTLFLERAESYELTGDYSGAIGDYNEANKLLPASGEYGLARIYALKGDVQTSLYHLEQNLNSPFRKAEKEILLDPSFGGMEYKPEWRSFWKKERYTDIEKIVSEIEFYTAEKDINQANTLLTDLVKNYPHADEAGYCEALVRMASGRPSEAVTFINSMAERHPDNEKYLLLLARAQKEASNPAGASETITRLLDRGVADANLLLERAECYRKTGEGEKALSDINKYLQLYPDSKTALSLAGKTEAVNGDNLRAMEFFTKNLELHPNDPDCYLDRGNSFLNSKSWDWAIKDYTMSLDLKPGNNEAWLNKGIALLSCGKVQDACHDFRKALSLGSKRAAEMINKNCIR
jgi:tetratricopeptide (TPR) repeat protein